MLSSRKSAIIVFDMDDTLVDRESVYARAQTEMLKTLRRSGAKRIRIPQSILTLRRIESELIGLHKGYHMYDYNELARALWLHFVNKLSGRKAAEQAYYENRDRTITFTPAITAASVHNNVLWNQMPPLLNSCREILSQLKKRYFLVLFASGNERLQIRVVRHHRLEKYFDMVVIRKVKNVSAFKQLKALAIKAFVLRLSRKPSRLVMVGDRISQDITPARNAGFETIWVPGPYFPGNRSQGKPTHKIKKLGELSRILLSKAGGQQICPLHHARKSCSRNGRPQKVP